ncbi:MAG: hypothetical protein H0Z28_09640 [Archaeoglobus sp.]|nr:hypothetical protein [Archaeoglobus sp.]
MPVCEIERQNIRREISINRLQRILIHLSVSTYARYKISIRMGVTKTSVSNPRIPIDIRGIDSRSIIDKTDSLGFNPKIFEYV